MKYYFWGLVILTLTLSALSFTSKSLAAGTDLIISEYIEGTSNNKAVEIYNPTADPIDFSNYKVQSYIDGAATVSTFATASATIAAGGTFVMCNASASASILSVCDKKVSGVGTVMTFNADDTLTLAKTDGTLVDVFGQIGTDPGTEWGTGLTSTQDNTLRRKCNLSVGDINGSDVFDPASEWDGLATDTFDGLGQHTLCFSTPVPTAISTSTATPSVTPTSTPTSTPTGSPQSTPTQVPNPTPTNTPVLTPIPSLTPMPTESPTMTPTPTLVPTETPLVTTTPAATPTPSPTLEPTPTNTPVQTPNSTPSGTPNPTASVTPKQKNNHDKHHFNEFVKNFVNKCGRFVHDFNEKLHEDSHNNPNKWLAPKHFLHLDKHNR